MSAHPPLPATGPDPTPLGHGVRQAFQYLLLLGLVVVTAIGIGGLLAAAFAQGTTIAVSDSSIARSVAFTLVGLPLLAGVALWTRRTFAADPAESRSPAWLLYLAAAELLALVVALVAVHATASWLVGLQEFEPDAAAIAVVWSAVWGGHRLLASRVDPRLLQPQHLGGSLITLGLSLAGLGVLLTGALETWFGLDGTVLAATGHRPALEGALTLLLAGAGWVLYWWRSARRSERNPLWLAYVLLAGIAAALVVTLVAGSLALHRVLVWLVGDPSTDDASRYFDPMPATVAAVVVGLVSLAHHHAVLAEGVRPGRSEVDRVHDYGLAAIGLGAAATGTTIVVVAIVEAVADPDVISGSGAVNTLLAALTLLAVGAPVWWLHWRRCQAAVGASHDEVTSPTRRLYLFSLLGVASLAAVVALLAGTWILIDRLLGSAGALEALRAIRYPIGILVTAAALAAYHWAVYLRERGTASERRGPRFVLLLGVADAPTAGAVARHTGAQTWAWTRTDAGEVVRPVAELLAVLASASTPEVVVLVEDGRLQAVPIERRPARTTG